MVAFGQKPYGVVAPPPTIPPSTSEAPMVPFGPIGHKLPDVWDYAQAIWIGYTAKVVTDPKTLSYWIEINFDYVNSWQSQIIRDKGFDPSITTGFLQVKGKLDSNSPPDPLGFFGLGTKGLITLCGTGFARKQLPLSQAIWNPKDLSKGRYAITGKLVIKNPFWEFGRPPPFGTYGEAVAALNSYILARWVFTILLIDAVEPGKSAQMGWPIVDRAPLPSGDKDLRNIKHPDPLAPIPFGRTAMDNDLYLKGHPTQGCPS